MLAPANWQDITIPAAASGEGAVVLQECRPGGGKASGFATLADATTYAIYKADVYKDACDACVNGAVVVLEMKTPASGKPYINGVRIWSPF